MERFQEFNNFDLESMHIEDVSMSESFDALPDSVHHFDDFDDSEGDDDVERGMGLPEARSVRNLKKRNRRKKDKKVKAPSAKGGILVRNRR